jgi:hypothetical protein
LHTQIRFEVADYLQQASLLDEVPMAASPIDCASTFSSTFDDDGTIF